MQNKNEILNPHLLLTILVATLVFFASVTLASAANSADTNNDGFISVAEGVPFYGNIVHSLTTSGGVGSGSALALDRFPKANDNGDYNYERTFTLSDDINANSEVQVVVHGYDLDNNGAYDGDKESSVDSNVPFEATVPIACGVVEAQGDGEYEADLEQLNSSGASGEANFTLNGRDVTVNLEMEDTSPNLAHAAHLHVGGDGTCPPNTQGVSEDNNGDDGEDDNDGENGNDDNNTYDNFRDAIRARVLQTQIDHFERLIERFQERVDDLRSRLADLM